MAFKTGRGARAKGGTFERKVRNELRRIYDDASKHGEIQRVPLSGGGWMKGDIIDLNDNTWTYEAKCQETLSLPAWWRQTKLQAKSFQTPCLVFSSNHRPMYWVMKAGDWESYEGETVLDGVVEYVDMTTRGLYPKLAALSQIQVGHTMLDKDEVVIVPNELYISLRRELVDGQAKRS